ncbi:MAG TPA: methyltransferase domain-containing protein [Gammaproteobacteria bacterium]|nr:methyltransferase domain-containing protein [Gammaproteobacteria bacterium]
MGLSKQELIALYRRRARRYDWSANLYYLLGFREQAYRRRAVAALGLTPGDTVVEIGCGTGLNFAQLHAAVGDEGRIIGVDLTDGMLAQASERIAKSGWTNVSVVQSDAAAYRFPDHIDGVLSTFALTLVPEFERVIANAAAALPAGGRFTILDLRRPERRPPWLVRLGVAVTAPFGVSLDLAERRPWEALERHFARVRYEALYFGFAYLASGEKG